MIRLTMSRRELAMLGASALAIAAVTAPGAQAQTAQSSSQATNDSAGNAVTEVVVTGQRAALRSAQQIKKNSDEIVDSIVADDIGKLPDRSVTEALQRVVGVTIDHTMARNDPEHFSVEGSGVNIRGLTYVRSELNGRDSFTANGGRSLSFEDVPPELMAGVDVYKNPSAAQIEGAIGGLVNLRTAMPFDFKGPRLSAAVEGSWGDLSQGKLAPTLSLMASDRWQTPAGEFGALIDFASSESRTRTDAIQQDPFYPRTDLVPGQTVWLTKGVSWRTLQFDRKREGDYAAFQWRPNEEVITSLTFFRSHYKMHWDEDAIFGQVNAYNIVPKAGTQFQYNPNGVFLGGEETDPTDGGMPFNDDVRSADRISTTTDVSWNLKWNVNDRLAVRTDLQYVRGTTNGFDSTVATGINLPSEVINRTGSIPTVGVDTSYLSNPSNYYWAFTMDHMDASVGKELAWSANADYKINNGFFKSLEAGVRLSRRDAETNNSPYNWQAVSQVWMKGWYIDNLAYLDQFQAPYQTYNFPNFFNGGHSLPSGVIFPAVSLATGWPASYQQLAAFRSTLCDEHAVAATPPGQPTQHCSYTWTPTHFDNSTLNTQREFTTAGFVMLKFGLDDLKFPIDGNVGVRVVQTNDTASGYMVVNALSVDPGNTPPPGQNYVGLQGSSQAINAKNDYINVLPSLNVRVKLTPKLQARFAVAKAMSRPDFSQLQAYTSLSGNITNGSPETFTGTGSGNPYLRPTKSNQFDATLEWYFSQTGSLTGAVFYKQLSDVVVNELYNTTITDAIGGPQTYTVTAPINGAKGTAKGFEIAYQQYFDFLPGPLKGFGVQANFTHVDSDTQLYKPVSSAYCTSGDAGAANLNLNLNGCDTDGRTFGNLPLANLSKNSYNLALLYDRGPISGRLAYNWRSKYLQAVNVNGTQGTDGTDTNPSSPTFGSKSVAWGLPTWADDYGQLDGSLFYKLPGDKITLGIEAQNLTDATYKQLMQQHIGMMGRAWFVTGRRITFQLRATF